jgi:hypothetical protein
LKHENFKYIFKQTFIISREGIFLYSLQWHSLKWSATLMYSIALIAAVGITLVSAWDISLHIDQEASNGIGGEVLESQPVISIFNKSGTKKYSGIVGRVVASLVSSSSHHQEILGFASAEGCTTIGFEDGVSVDLNDSEVHFSGLCINRAGLGYSIRYLFFDEFDILLGDGLQSNISIEVGQPYKIGVVQAPERVQGGVAWELNPIVSVQDKGQNIVTGIGEGNVSDMCIDCKYSKESMIDSLICAPLLMQYRCCRCRLP